MLAVLNLTKEPETVDFPASHYVFVEQTGNIPAIAQQTWMAVHAFLPEIVKQNRITGGAALYKTGPGIYRAGFLLAEAPADLPEGLNHEVLRGGKYARFTLTGPFDQLPEATRRAFEIVAEKKIPLRDDFNIEHYITDPATTPAEKNITEILFPTA